MSRQRPHLILIVSTVLALPAAAQHEAFAPSAQPSSVHWQHDLEAAKATAKQTGRLVLIHFWTPSCGPCLMLDQHVFNQPGVAGALEAQFVPVKLNANEHSATAQALGITRVPTDVILTPDGQIVGRLISPPTPAAYVAETTQLARQHSTKAGGAFAQAAAAAPLPPTINSAYANLQIAPNTPPALLAPAAEPAPDRYAMAMRPFAAAAPASSQALDLNNAPTALQPVAVPAPNNDRYASAAVPHGAPSTSPAPTQVANPYTALATTPAITPSPPTMPTALPASLPATEDSSSGPPSGPPLGFDGYCPVSMRTQWKWVPGDPRWGIVHRGRTYWFAGQAEQQQFWADPDRYSPALSGMDPVMAIDHRQQVPGKREHSIDYDNLFYMFASEATLQQFTSTPERYATGVRQAMGIPRGRLVR